MPHDQISAAVALYGRINISGATYGNVPQRLSNNRSLPLILSKTKLNHCEIDALFMMLEKFDFYHCT